MNEDKIRKIVDSNIILTYDPDAPSYDYDNVCFGSTALISLSYWGNNPDTIKLLIDGGAEVIIEDGARHYIVKINSNNTQLIKQLKDSGVEIILPEN